MKKLFLILAFVALVAGISMADDMKFSGSVVPYFYVPALDSTQLYFELTPTLNLQIDKTFSAILAADSTFDSKSLSNSSGGIKTMLKSGYVYTGGKADFGFIDAYAHVGVYYDGLLYWDFLTDIKAIPGVTFTVEYVGADAVAAKGTLEGWCSISF